MLQKKSFNIIKSNLSLEAIQQLMGGDSFEGVEKLTNQQYHTLVAQILQILQPFYIRAEPYVAMPEKTIHGDIDFLMILKPQFKAKHLIQALSIELFRINNNDTTNSVYKNKQVDFCFKANDEEFEMAKFYKSYSGMGAHLGLFLPSKEVKLSDSGLFALAYKQHIKFQFLITNQVRDILTFYGLDFETYQKGFQTRKSLFQYLRGCIFMNEKRLVECDHKNQSKLSKFFIQYLKNQATNIREQPQKKFGDPIKETLIYFKKQQQFKENWEKLLESVQKRQKLNKKFNGLHIMEHFKVEAKKVNKLKDQFRKTFEDMNQYERYIDEHSLQEILFVFSQKLSITPQPKTNSRMGFNRYKTKRRSAPINKHNDTHPNRIKVTHLYIILFFLLTFPPVYSCQY